MAAVQPASADANVFSSAFGPVHKTTYVDNTYITSTGGNHFALCHAVETQAFMGMGMWIVSDGYVLSETNCDGQSARENPGLINVAFAAGALNGTPREPVLSMRQRVEGHALFGILGLIAIAGLGWRISRRGPAQLAEGAASRRNERKEVLGLEDETVFRFIDVMLHAASVDDTPSAEQIEYIRVRAIEMTEVDYTDDHIEWAASQTEKLNDAADFAQFGTDLDQEQSRLMLRAAMAVLAADGDMTIKERKFVKLLSEGLGLGEAEARYLLQEPAAFAAQ